MARLPIDFPLDLHVTLRTRRELESVVLVGRGSEGLHREALLSRLEIVKKGGPLGYSADRCTIRVNYRV